MPKYDYKCSDCQGLFRNVEHSMDDNLTGTSCADLTFELEGFDSICEGTLRKVFSATPGHFKGSGWGRVYGVHKPKPKN